MRDDRDWRDDRSGRDDRNGYERSYDRSGYDRGGRDRGDRRSYGRDSGREKDGTRIYVGSLSRHLRSGDIEDLFSRYGRVRDVDLKTDYAFVEMRSARDADEAVRRLDGKRVDGRTIAVEFARSGRPRPGDLEHCFNCGSNGHWAKECPNGDWGDKCWRCGERGHTKRDCRNEPLSPGSRPIAKRSGDGGKRSHRKRSRSRSASPDSDGGRPRKRGYDSDDYEGRRQDRDDDDDRNGHDEKADSPVDLPTKAEDEREERPSRAKDDDDLRGSPDDEDDRKFSDEKPANVEPAWKNDHADDDDDRHDRHRDNDEDDSADEKRPRDDE